jgi:hypothetical protein
MLQEAPQKLWGESHLRYVKHRLYDLFRRIPPESLLEKPMKT